MIRVLAPESVPRRIRSCRSERSIAYTDGKTGWLVDAARDVMPMPAEVLKQAQGELFRDLLGLMLSTRDASRTVNAVGDNAVADLRGRRAQRESRVRSRHRPSLRSGYQEPGRRRAV